MKLTCNFYSQCLCTVVNPNYNTDVVVGSYPNVALSHDVLAGENLPLVQKGLRLSAKQSFLLQPLLCIQSFSKFHSLLMSVVSHFGM